jgi:hypothetical protein
MISFDAIAISIAHERQETERRIRRDMQRARRQQEGIRIRRRIGERFIRWGHRLMAGSTPDPVWSR